MTVRSNRINWVKKAKGWPWEFLSERDRQAIPSIETWLNDRAIKGEVRDGIDGALQDSDVASYFRRMGIPKREFVYLIVSHFVQAEDSKTRALQELKRIFLRRPQRLKFLRRMYDAKKLVTDLEHLAEYANRVREAPVFSSETARIVEREIENIEELVRALKTFLPDVWSYLERKPKINLGVGGSPGKFQQTALIIKLRNFFAHFGGENRPARNAALIVRILSYFAIEKDEKVLQKLLVKHPIRPPFFTRSELAMPPRTQWVPSQQKVS